MTVAVTHDIRVQRLAVDRVLLQRAQQSRRLAALSTMIGAVAFAAAAGLGLILLDVWWPIPSVGRVAVAMILALMVVMVFGWCLRAIRRNGSRSRWVMLQEASCIETRMGLRHHPLVNAVWLGGETSFKQASLPSRLVGRCVDRAESVLHTASSKHRPETKVLLRLVITLLMIFTAWTVAGWVEPYLVGHGLCRLVLPFGDYPPYSRTRFEVVYHPNDVKIGDDVTVVARVTGRVPQEEPVELIEQTDDDRRAGRRWRMTATLPPAIPPQIPLDMPTEAYPEGGADVRFKTSEKVYEYRLTRLDRPITLRVATLDGVSQRIRIEPRSIEVNELTTNTHTGDEHESGDRSSTPTTESTPNSDQGQRDTTQATRETLARLHELVELTHRLKEQIERLLAQAPFKSNEANHLNELTLQSVSKQLEQYASLVEQLQAVLPDRSAMSAQQVGPDLPLNSPWAQLRAALNQLKLTRIHSGSMKARNDADGPAVHAASQSVLREIESAAHNDAARLTGQVEAIEKLIGASSDGRLAINPVTGTSNVNIDNHMDTVRIGDHSERVMSSQGKVESGDARVRHVPMMYREAVELYFQRLVADDSTGRNNTAVQPAPTRLDVVEEGLEMRD